jgi:dienelactone hydrolase
MKKNRRDFLKLTGLTGLGVASGLSSLGQEAVHLPREAILSNSFKKIYPMEENVSIIGQYGPWAASLNGNRLPEFSFRRKEWPDVGKWRDAARKRAMERMAIPDIGRIPEVRVVKQYTFDGLAIEELEWQLPFGRATQAIVLKPENQKGRLPGILAFHDHGGNKYFGTRKITKTGTQHPMMVDHQKVYYEGAAWANEVAKRGYVVLVADVFTFGSRRVMMEDIPSDMRDQLHDNDPENEKNINAYNDWAGQHEHVMAKSLFCAGTTWPGVFFAEDRMALNILSARNDVDADKLGCAGLSGGGLRTALMGGLDQRIKCAVDVGFMTTWRDFLLNKSFTHTWMAYVPLLPNELDFPEILGLRAPLPTLVLNDSDDFLYTLPEMKRADQILSEVYKKAGAEAHYKCSFYPGPHKFDSKMQGEAFAWFDRWLR